jgi:Thioredoxin domain-containing protein
MTITFDSFEDFENKIYTDKPVFIEFYTDWCRDRLKTASFIEDLELDERIIGKIDVYRCNIDEQEDIAEYCDVTDLPSCVCFQNGTSLFTMEGLNKDKLKNHLYNIIES